MSDRTRGQKRRKVSLTKVIIASVLTLAILAVFPVAKHYLTYDMTWNGGLSRLVQFMVAGVFFGIFPAIAGLVAVLERFNEGKSVFVPAVLVASVTWVVQYAIVLFTIDVGPALSDALYGLVSVFCAAALALLVGSGKRRSTAS